MACQQSHCKIKIKILSFSHCTSPANTADSTSTVGHVKPRQSRPSATFKVLREFAKGTSMAGHESFTMGGAGTPCNAQPAADVPQAELGNAASHQFEAWHR